MPSRNATIAEAVRVALNAAAATPERFGASFVARRVYAPVTAAETQRDWVVTVFAPGDTAQPLTRARWAHEVPVLVGIERRLARSVDPTDPDANATLDAYTELAERVADFFAPGFDAAGAKLKTDPPPRLQLQHPDAARQQKRFVAVVTLFFLTY